MTARLTDKRKDKDKNKLLVPAAEDMLLQTFRQHVQLRHGGRLGFYDSDAHAADHETRGDELNHIHKPPTDYGDAA